MYENFTDAINNKWLVLDEIGKPEEALVWFDKAIKQSKSDNETDMDFISSKAFALGLKLEQYDEALSLTDDI